jgi:hypothetical protein
MVHVASKAVWLFLCDALRMHRGIKMQKVVVYAHGFSQLWTGPRIAGQDEAQK